MARRTALLAPAVALLALLPGFLRDAGSEDELAGDQLFLHSYKTALFHADPTDPRSPLITPGAFLERSAERSGQVLASLGSRLASEEGSLAIGAVLVGFLAVSLVRRREPAELFAVLALVILSTYFAFRTRLSLSVYALALVSAADVLLQGLGHVVRRRPAEWIVAALLLGLMVVDWRPREHWKEIARDHALRVESAARLAERLPEHARLAGHNGLYFEVYLDRPVLRTRILRDRAGFAAVESMLREQGIDFLLIDEVLPDSQAFLQWARSSYGSGVPCGSAVVFPLHEKATLH
jgi:hypothetical protein